MSADPRKKLEEEIHSLERELREELPKALKTAAALGDLSENADYSAARERQDFVRARLGQLKKRVADLSLVNFDKIPTTGFRLDRRSFSSMWTRAKRSPIAWSRVKMPT
jgi:transcription elongation GreA/GreB family factor